MQIAENLTSSRNNGNAVLPAVLHLTLTKKWFDMIASGEKKEEYRELKTYWIQRLIDIQHPEEEPRENKVIPANIVFDIIENGYAPNDVLKAYYSKYRQFDYVEFKNGYSKSSPTILLECKGVKICDAMSYGFKGKCFVIALGKLVMSAV